MAKVDFTDNYHLKLQLKPPHLSRNYGVLYTYVKGKAENTLRYNVTVSYVKTLGDRRIFRIEREEPVYVNDLEPDLVADELAYACGKVYYPLLLEVDFSGKYHAVHNHAEVLGRWNTQKAAVLDYFKGEIAAKYVSLMDEAIATPELLTAIFSRELFCSTFFSSLYRSYTAAFEIEEMVAFPIAGSAAPLNFKTRQKVNPELNAAGKIELIHSGEMADERSMRDINEEYDFAISKYCHPDEQPAEGNYTNIIRLDAETGAVFSIVADWTLVADPVQRTEVKIFELLEKEEEVKQAEYAQPGQFILDGQHEKKEKKFTDLFSFLTGK